MYKIMHKSTKKFLSHSGHRYFFFLHDYYPAEKFLSKNGKTWSTKKGTEQTMKRLELFYPGQFKIIEFVEAKNGN